jgi:hypothetical protein
LRAIADVQTVAAQVRDAWSQATGMQAQPAVQQSEGRHGSPELQVSPT